MIQQTAHLTNCNLGFMTESSHKADPMGLLFFAYNPNNLLYCSQEVKWHLKNTAGFTLIELILVIAILGILSVMAIPVFQNTSGHAYRAQAEAIIGHIRSGITLNFAKTAVDSTVVDTYPAHLDIATAGLCEKSNLCFNVVMSYPVVDGSWEKTDTDAYRHVKSKIECQYISDSSHQRWGQFDCIWP